MKCPHKGCTGKIDTTIMVTHAESYGGSVNKVLCPKCERGVRVVSEVVVKLHSVPYVGPATTGTWGGDIPASEPKQVPEADDSRLMKEPCSYCSGMIRRETYYNEANGSKDRSEKNLLKEWCSTTCRVLWHEVL